MRDRVRDAILRHELHSVERLHLGDELDGVAADDGQRETRLG